MPPWVVLFCFCFLFYLCSFRLSSHFPFICVGPYPVPPCHGFGGRGRCTLPFWRWSFCIHSCTRTGVQTNLARHGGKELIHLTPRSKPLGACAVRWMAGWCVCVLCYHPTTTKHQGPSNPRTTYVWYHTRTSLDYRIIMFCDKKSYLYFVCKYLICIVVPRFLRKQTIYLRFLHVPPVVYSGCWAGTWRRQLVFAFEAVTSGQKGYVFGQVGGNGG